MKASKWRCEVCAQEFDSEMGAADCEVSHGQQCDCQIRRYTRLHSCPVGQSKTLYVSVNYNEKAIEFETYGGYLKLNVKQIKITHCPFCGREL
jgi:rubredoxin